MTSEAYTEIIMDAVNKVASNKCETVGFCTLTNEQKDELRKIYRAYIDNKKKVVKC